MLNYSLFFILLFNIESKQAICKLEKEIKVTAKVRYAGKPAEATIYPEPYGKVRVSFKEKQRAITRGQSVVFYDRNIVVGGGIIEKIL